MVRDNYCKWLSDRSQNILNKDGDCEDINKIASYYSTIVLDQNIKFVGNNSVKSTSSGGQNRTGALINSINSRYSLDPNKYYLVSAYFYVPSSNTQNASYGVIASITGGSTATGSTSAIWDSWVRKAVKIQPSNMVGMTNFQLIARLSLSIAATGQIMYNDCFMICEISSDEYNLSETELMAKYPYKDGVVPKLDIHCPMISL